MLIWVIHSNAVLVKTVRWNRPGRIDDTGVSRSKGMWDGDRLLSLWRQEKSREEQPVSWLGVTGWEPGEAWHTRDAWKRARPLVRTLVSKCPRIQCFDIQRCPNSSLGKRVLLWVPSEPPAEGMLPHPQWVRAHHPDSPHYLNTNLSETLSQT